MSREMFCERCSLQFGKKYVFELHLSLVHGEKIEVKSELPLCEENLEESQVNETKFSYQPVPKKERSFKCNVCFANFTKKNNLTRHMTSVHAGKKPFRCDICDYSCSQKGDLNKHVASVHEEKKPFKCDICDYSCFQKGDMKRHIVSVHEGKKPFKCDICDYSQKSQIST